MYSLRLAFRSRRASTSASLGRLGFHEEADGQPSASRVPPPPALYGLTDFQMQALGLTGDEVTRRLAVVEVRGRGARVHATRAA